MFRSIIHNRINSHVGAWKVLHTIKEDRTLRRSYQHDPRHNHMEEQLPYHHHHHHNKNQQQQEHQGNETSTQNAQEKLRLPENKFPITTFGNSVSSVCVYIPLTEHPAKKSTWTTSSSTRGPEDEQSFLSLQQEICTHIAQKLQLPLLTSNQFDIHSNTIISTNIHSSFTHLLHVIPYSLPNTSLQTYAVAIQPIPQNQYIRNKNPNNVQGLRNGSRNKPIPMMQPFFVDFCPSFETQLGQRLQQRQQQKSHSTSSDLLLQAVFSKKWNRSSNSNQDSNKRPIVYDLTAGFGQDALLLATAGYGSMVHMVERNPIVAELLLDAVRRMNLIASCQEDTRGDEHTATRIQQAREIQSRLVLHPPMDSVHFLHSIKTKISPSATCKDEENYQYDCRPDVCYLDPMFPPRSKSAAVKKNMQILHGLLQIDSDSSDDDVDGGDVKYIKIGAPVEIVAREEKSRIEKDEKMNESKKTKIRDESTMKKELGRREEEQKLLTEALSIALSRVVVKRPINQEPLGGADFNILPSYSIKGSTNRWDVYLLSS